MVSAILDKNEICFSDFEKSEIKFSDKTLSELEQRIGECVVKRMKQITEMHSLCLKEYKEDSSHLYKGFWYADELLKACQETKQFELTALLKENRHLNLLYGQVSEKYFDRIKAEGYFHDYVRFHFIVKKNVLPSDAINALFKERVIGDCGMACNIAYYGALMDLLGTKKFNKLFGKKGQRLTTGFVCSNDQPLNYFVNFTAAAKSGAKGKKSARPVQIGQILGFQGVKNYLDKKPFGDGASKNEICTSETKGLQETFAPQKFIGLGLEKEVNETELCVFLLDKYNKDEDPLYLIHESDKEKCHETWKKMTDLQKRQAAREEISGYYSRTPRAFDVNLIQKLINLPLKKVSMKYVKDYAMEKKSERSLKHSSYQEEMVPCHCVIT